MKIVKPGKRRPVKFRTKCRQCGAVLEAGENELTWEHDVRDGTSLARMSCPQCNNEVFFYKP